MRGLAWVLVLWRSSYEAGMCWGPELRVQSTGFSGWEGNTAWLQSREAGRRLPGFDYSLYFLAARPWESDLNWDSVSSTQRWNKIVPTSFTKGINNSVISLGPFHATLTIQASLGCSLVILPDE